MHSKILYWCVLVCVFYFSLTGSFSLPALSIVGRQMGASVTRKELFDHSEAWVHYEGYEQWRWLVRRGGDVGVRVASAGQKPVRFAVCCRA